MLLLYTKDIRKTRIRSDFRICVVHFVLVCLVEIQPRRRLINSRFVMALYMSQCLAEKKMAIFREKVTISSKSAFFSRFIREGRA
jgi:hypothetical protein